jgi:HSP20 family molecular chaperone IbpA
MSLVLPGLRLVRPGAIQSRDGSVDPSATPDPALLDNTNRPGVMPMDAWREGDCFVIEFDLPGVSPQTIDRDT